MLNLTRKVDYGILLLTHLGMKDGKALSARQLADHYKLSPSLTASVLKSLQKAKLVKSTRGVKGGYSLNRRPEEINLGVIIRVLEGYWSMVECLTYRDQQRGREQDNCEIDTICPIRSSMKLLGDQIRALLDSISIQDLINQANNPENRRIPVIPSFVNLEEHAQFQ